MEFKQAIFAEKSIQIYSPCSRFLLLAFAFCVQENLSAEVIDGFSSLESDYATEEEYGALGLNSDYEMSDVNVLSGTNYEPINWEDFSEVSQESEYMSELNDTNFDNYSSSEAFLVSDSAIAEDIL